MRLCPYVIAPTLVHFIASHEICTARKLSLLSTYQFKSKLLVLFHWQNKQNQIVFISDAT